MRKRWKRGATILLTAWLLAGAILFWIFYRRPLWVLDQAMHARLHFAGMHSRFVRVGPYRVHYLVGGHGQPLLLIHGLGSRAEDWAPEIPAYLDSGFRVYAIDLLGCGRTERPDIAYTIQQQTDLVHGFLDAVHVPRADVIGWSMGGWVALQFAVEYPDHVRRVIAMDSAGIRFSTHLTAQTFEPRTIPQLEELESLLDPHPPWLPGFFIRALLRAMRSNSTVMHCTVDSIMSGRDLLDDRLSSLHMPVLLVWGAEDALIPPSVGLQMHSKIPQSEVEIYSGCGHVGPARCANRIVPNVIEFLRKEPAPVGGVRYY